MYINIVNLQHDIIMHVEKDGDSYMMHFRKEEDAIKFAENVLQNIEYRLERHTTKEVNDLLEKYWEIGKADL